MNPLVLDVETTIKGNGDWANRDNRLCLVGLLSQTETTIYDIEYTIHPYDDCIRNIQLAVDACDIIVGFNIKFDLHWLLNYGISINKPVYDLQLAEFVFSGQQNVYPSLDKTAMRYGLGQKLDVVKTEYWEKGIDTPEVPKDILYDYLEQDLKLTERLYKTHLALSIPENTKTLLELLNEDLMCILEMEHNGLYYDEDLAKEERKLYKSELDTIDFNLGSFFPDCPWINWNSGDHVSAILFGGTIKWVEREEVGVFLTGQKIGLPRYKINRYEKEFPRLAQPAKGTALKKDGLYSTGEDAFQKVTKASKEAKAIVKLLQRKSKLEKLVGTYYHNDDETKGIATLGRRKNWDSNRLFGSYDQCVAITGRLASNSPNQQNFPEEVDRLLYSRFED